MSKDDRPDLPPERETRPHAVVGKSVVQHVRERLPVPPKNLARAIAAALGVSLAEPIEHPVTAEELGEGGFRVVGVPPGHEHEPPPKGFKQVGGVLYIRACEEKAVRARLKRNRARAAYAARY